MKNRLYKKFKAKYQWPSSSQWYHLPEILTKKEKTLFLGFFILFLCSSGFLAINFYFKNTEIKPAVGGEYVEGLIGHPRFINPIFASANDVDRDLTELIFSGLMKYNAQGEIVPDLAQEYEIKEDGKIIEVCLKENIFWHDNEKFIVDDIIFTIKTIQNPDYKSPLRANWLGVKTEKIDDQKLRFELSNPYSAFLERLTLKILPKHIWQDISPENFPLSKYNLEPIGTGPYKVKNLKQNQDESVVSISLERHKNYFAQKSFLKRISFLFFDNMEDLLFSAQKKEIKGFALLPPFPTDIKQEKLNEHSYSLPRYFAIFLNPQKSRFLKEVETRQALNYATNKAEIIEKILLGKGKIVVSPVLPEIYGYELPSVSYEFNPEKAEQLLEKAGFEKREGKFVEIIKKQSIEFKSQLTTGSRGEEVRALQTCLSQMPEIYPSGQITGYFGSATKQGVIKFQEKFSDEILKPWGYTKGTGIVGKTTRTKLNEICGQGEEKIFPLKFVLITAQDPLLQKTAELIKEQWGNIGIEIEIKAEPVSQLEGDFIKPREYECLLFGEVLNIIPDPFPFWHSSQIKDPGLNLSKYENKKADELLEKIRISSDPKDRQEMYEKFQNILLQDAPAVFLYSPDYVYFISQEIKGIETGLIADPSKRFAGIENWYIKTKRGRK
jgi:peptide/nickel transport system substrate-binding protein